jgi:hypothetical protein
MKKPIKKAAAKKISEYGGMEKYTSKKAEMKHEKSEGKKVEKKEKMSFAKKTVAKKTVAKSTKKPFIYGN